MKRFLIVLLAVLLCGTTVFTRTTSPTSDNAGNVPDTPKAETIRYTDISGDYLFVQNLSETERMSRSLRDYLGDCDIQTSIPDDAICFVENTWDPAWAVALPGGSVYCVEAWDIYKDGEFQKTSYQVCRI